MRRTFTRYRNENGKLFEITGDLFERFYAKKLYWQSRVWSPYGTVQDFVLNVEPLPFSMTKFKIHVNKEESFLSNFEPLKTSTKHSSTLMKPKDVNPFNWYLAWVTLYGSARGELPLPKFRVGDTVRVSRYKSTFGKGYEANFTEEIFKVKGVLSARFCPERGTSTFQHNKI